MAYTTAELAKLAQHSIDLAVFNVHARKQREYTVKAVNQYRIQVTASWNETKFTNNIDLDPADLRLFAQFTKKELQRVMPRWLYQNLFNTYQDLYEHMTVQYPDVDAGSVTLLYLTAFNQLRSILAFCFPYASTVLPNERPNPEDEVLDQDGLYRLRRHYLMRDLSLISLYPDRAIKNIFYVAAQIPKASDDQRHAYLLYAINYDVVYDEIERRHAHYAQQ